MSENKVTIELPEGYRAVQDDDGCIMMIKGKNRVVLCIEPIPKPEPELWRPDKNKSYCFINSVAMIGKGSNCYMPWVVDKHHADQTCTYDHRISLGNCFNPDDQSDMIEAERCATEMRAVFAASKARRLERMKNQ